MPITILNLDSAIRLADRYRAWDLVSILDSDPRQQERADLQRLELFRSTLRVRFDDVTEPSGPDSVLRAPTLEDMRQIIDWCRDKDLDQLAVHCVAGISRSSATAIVITCSHGVPPVEAFDTLIARNRHAPNRLILSLGRQILKMDGIIGEYLRRFVRR